MRLFRWYEGPHDCVRQLHVGLQEDLTQEASPSTCAADGCARSSCDFNVTFELEDHELRLGFLREAPSNNKTCLLQILEASVEEDWSAMRSLTIHALGLDLPDKDPIQNRCPVVSMSASCGKCSRNSHMGCPFRGVKHSFTGASCVVTSARVLRSLLTFVGENAAKGVL